MLILRIPDLDREGRRGEGTLLGVAAAGIRQIVSIPELRGITAAAAIGLGGLGLMTVAFPLFAVEHLGGERSDAGFMWAAFAAGSTIGALSLVRLQRRVPPARIVLAGYAVFGTLMLTWPLAGSLPVLMLLIAAAGLADGPALAAQFAVRQQVVPPSLYGQVFTTAAGLKVGSFAMGAALAGPVATGLGSAEAMLVAAAAQVTAAVVGVTLMRMPAAGAASGLARRLSGRQVVGGPLGALADPGDHQDRGTDERQQVLAERAVEQPHDDQQAGPDAGGRDHRAVAERQVEASCRARAPAAAPARRRR